MSVPVLHTHLSFTVRPLSHTPLQVLPIYCFYLVEGFSAERVCKPWQLAGRSLLGSGFLVWKFTAQCPSRCWEEEGGQCVPRPQPTCSASQGAGTDEKTLIEILTTRNNEEIRAINEAYKEGECGVVQGGTSRTAPLCLLVATGVGHSRCVRNPSDEWVTRSDSGVWHLSLASRRLKAPGPHLRLILPLRVHSLNLSLSQTITSPWRTP